MSIFSLIIPIDGAPGGSARFLFVMALLLAIGVLAAPCAMVGAVAITQAIADALI